MAGYTFPPCRTYSKFIRGKENRKMMMKNYNATEDFVDLKTGKRYPRHQVTVKDHKLEFIYLSEPEIVSLKRFAERYNYDLGAVLEDENDYISFNWETIPVSYRYTVYWINRNIEMGNTKYIRGNE